MPRIYLDHNATTPVDSRVLDAMLPYLRDQFGNPSSVHWFGQQARRGIDRARQQVASLIGATAPEIVFTGGGTEANNLAIKGVLAHIRHVAFTNNQPPPPLHVITSAVEHAAVSTTCQSLTASGVAISVVPVDCVGRVDPAQVEAAITDHTVLITLMLANNDFGTIQPIAEIAALGKARGIAVHTDAIQAVGKIKVDVAALGVDMLSLSGHKFYGPKGVGALYVRRGTRLSPLIHGGGQEMQRRSGTENVPGIVGLGEAAAVAQNCVEENTTTIAALRDRLEHGLTRRLSRLRVNGDPAHRLPNTLHMSFAGVDGNALLMNLDLEEIAVSTGSACSSGKVTTPAALAALGMADNEALGSVRLSLGSHTTTEEIDRVIEVMTTVVNRLRGEE